MVDEFNSNEEKSFETNSMYPLSKAQKNKKMKINQFFLSSVTGFLVHKLIQKSVLEKGESDNFCHLSGKNCHFRGLCKIKSGFHATSQKA